jgi:hypothetical protein
MPDPEAVPLEALRQALAARVEEAGHLPTIAREIGVSSATLRKFLDGRDLYAKTRRRLLEWWGKHHVKLLPEVSSPAISAALDDIFSDVPPEQRPGTRDRFLATLSRLYAAHPDDCPPWIGELVLATSGGAPDAASATNGTEEE